MSTPTILALLPSHERRARAQGRAPATIGNTAKAVGRLTDWLGANGRSCEIDLIDRGHDGGLLHLSGRRRRGAGPYVGSRCTSGRCRAFFNWAADEEEIDVSPMARMREPRAQSPAPEVLDGEGFAALLKACKGKAFGTVGTWR